MDVPVYDMQGKQISSFAVDEAALGGQVNPLLIKQAYVRYHANRRQGSARTKNRSLVDGSTRKLYKQKGTGNARAGTIRTGIRRGGGRIFAKLKKREEYHQDMPVKMRRKANRNALLAKLIDGEVKVVDSLAMAAPKTRNVKELLQVLGVDRSVLVALAPDNANARRAARNLPEVTVCNSRQLTCWDMLSSRYMVIAREDLEAWIGGAGAVVDKAYNRKRGAQRAEAA